MRLALVGVALLTISGCGIARWPVDGHLSSDFGLRVIGFRPEIHRGVDFNVPTGTEVRAMSDARVRYAGVMRGFGNVVWLDHGGSLLSVYAHLSEIRVREGERVLGGQVIALSGATGNVTAPNLHFEVWRWGYAVDPVPLMGGKPRG